jgi:hypothetical protein
VEATELEIAWVVEIEVTAWVGVVTLTGFVAPVFGFPLVPKFLPIQKDAIAVAVNRRHTPRILPMRRGLRDFFFTG